MIIKRSGTGTLKKTEIGKEKIQLQSCRNLSNHRRCGYGTPLIADDLIFPQPSRNKRHGYLYSGKTKTEGSYPVDRLISSFFMHGEGNNVIYGVAAPEERLFLER